MRGCVFSNCLALGEWLPTIHVRLPDNDNPFKLDFENLSLCNNHKEEFTITRLVNDKRLKDIQTLFRLSFLPEPSISHMTLSWVRDTHTSMLKVYDDKGKELLPLTDIRNKDLSTKA